MDAGHFNGKQTEPMEEDPLWYKGAIIYELHVKAFFDGNGDGVGDFPGLIAKLDYLQELGVTRSGCRRSTRRRGATTVTTFLTITTSTPTSARWRISAASSTRPIAATCA